MKLIKMTKIKDDIYLFIYKNSLEETRYVAVDFKKQLRTERFFNLQNAMRLEFNLFLYDGADLGSTLTKWKNNQVILNYSGDL